MITLVFQSTATDVIGVKEVITAALEPYGDIRCVEVIDNEEQDRIMYHGTKEERVR